jgi:tetratricopeptide (TPR) repeat protein/DNA-binding MarR family transcriptional regulator
MRKKLKFFVSTENRILLHLKEYPKTDPAKRVPREITQQGIADTLGSPRGSVSRALSNLMRKNFVEENLCRVLDSKRRINAYFLTWDGRTQSGTLESRLATEMLEARLENGTVSEITVSEAIDMAEPRLSIPQLLKIVEREGFYDPSMQKLDAVEPSMEAGPGTATVDSGSIKAVPQEAVTPVPAVPVEKAFPYMSIPPVRMFFGRRNELDEFQIKFKKFPVFIVEGMAGIGKTTLVSKVLTDLESSWKIFWYRMQDWDKPRSILQGIAEFLNELGRGDLLTELNTSGQELNMYSITKILIAEFKEIKAVLVLDDFHRASDSLQQLLTALIESLDSESNVRLIIIARTHLPIYDLRDSTLKEKVNSLKLDGLDETSSREMFRGMDVQDEDFKKIYTVTGGHPLAIELIQASGNVSDFKDIMQFIKEQVLQKLTKEEKALFMSISVHRVPAPLRAFLIEDDADFDTVDSLINKTLLLELESDRYSVHNIIREFFYSRLVSKQRKAYHLHAAEYFSDAAVEDQNVIEAVFHYINADAQDSAAEIMITRAPELLERGYLEEAMNILTSFDSNVSLEHLARLNTLKGDILSIWGEWDNVFEYYWQSYFLTLMANQNSEPDKAGFLKSVGLIGWKPPEVEAARTNLSSSLKVLSSSGDLEGAVEVENSLAWLNWMIGEYDDSEKLYNKLYNKLESKNDSSGTAKILIKLGNVYWSRNNLKHSIESYEKGLDLFRSSDDVYGTVRAISQLALMHVEGAEYDKGNEYIQKGLDLSDKYHFKKGWAYLLLHYAQNLVLQGKSEKARTELVKAQETFETLHDALGSAYSSALAGLISKYSGEPKQAIKHFELALRHMHGSMMPYYKSRMYKELSLIYKDTGDMKKSKESEQLAVQKMNME